MLLDAHISGVRDSRRRVASWSLESIVSTTWKPWILFLVFAAFSASSGLSQSVESNQAVETGVILVQYELGVSLGKAAYPSVLEIQSIEAAFPFLGNLTEERAQLPSVQALKRIYRVTYDADISPYQAARMIENNPGVRYAEPQYRSFIDPIPAQMHQNQNPPGNHNQPIPNDPMFLNEGYMEMMEITKAWDVVKGEDGEVIIAIVDSGTDWEHPDLLENVWENPGEIPGNGIDDDGNGFVDDVHGWNFYNNTNDPKPLEEGPNFHGTAVAGAAVAVANNGMGLAGTSWNAKFMPINVVSGPNSNLFFPNAGVLYAAMNGAHIINASYGSARSYSQTTSIVYRAAQDLGSLVVAAAGNQGFKLGGYLGYHPASYLTTLSVCGTEPNSYTSVFNYGYSVDVCAAGRRVTTTTLNNAYGRYSGTSFATPLTAGIAALVKTQYPQFTPQQIREQIRATADNEIYDGNPPFYAGLLGRGYVNAYQAVTEMDNISVRMTKWTAADENDDDRFDLSEPIEVTATFESFLANADNLTIELVAKPAHAIFPNGNHLSLGSLRSGEKDSIDFSVIPIPSTPYRSFLFIEPRITTPEGELVSGSDAIWLLVNEAQLALHETSTFSYTMTSEGNIGYVDFSNQNYYSAPGVRGQMTVNGEEFTHQAGLLVGAGPGGVAGSVFGARSPERWWGQNQDFVPAGPFELLEKENEQQVSRMTLNDKSSKLPAGLAITQESMVSRQERYADVALFRYRLRNQTSSAMVRLHAGLYFSVPVSDQVGMAKYQNVSVEEVFPYMRLNISGGGYVGFAVLSDQAPKHYRTYDDGWSDERWESRAPEEAWPGLSGGIVPGGQSNGGDGQLFASGPYTIEAFSEVVIDFAMIYGEDMEDLIKNASRMHQLRERWRVPAAITAPAEVSIIEGDSATFGIALTAPPSDDVLIMLTGHESTDLVPDQTTLTFRADQWPNGQAVILNTRKDHDIENDKATLVLSASGGSYASVNHTMDVTILDNGIGAIQVPMSVEVAEGESTTFEVSLKASPLNDMTMTFRGYEDTDLVPDPKSMVFTTSDWRTIRTVNIVTETDSDFSNDIVPLTLTASGGGYSVSHTIAVTITDSDEATIFAPTSVEVLEGDSEALEIALSAPPSGYVIMTLAGHENTDLTIAPAALAFNVDNWSTAQTVTLTAAPDEDFENDEVTLILTASGGGYDQVTLTVQVTIKDADEANILAPSTVTVREGDTSTFGIALTAQPTGNVTVKVSGYEGTDLAVAPPSPLNLTYTSANYTIVQSVTLNAAEDNDNLDDEVTLTLTAGGGGYAATHEVTVTIEDHYSLNISEPEIPKKMTLWGNYPNPSWDATKIEFDLPAPAQVSVVMTNMLGRTVKTLPYGWLGAGKARTIEMNTVDLPSGVYYYTLRAEMGERLVEQSKSMIIVR